ncbi:nucleotide exchange factor GrpE [Aggregatibacter actinomycetemcomitans]|uniref:nucleotide exchange factor GrpE n=1 Tax=Aggregatibacter actinomycetemcomitans TaxID=714 RepID=UPI0001B9F504|nr:nucleotide exchange factor GrpE [Aggregatibacter actinomycetemcomitans]ACX82237.1 molecular chaperone GrpE [Aggregatibacter actinomycetemcomitans D11S-1]KOE57603.1 molecular chaperone GrpE [Aggregatibacter actinomycetemcomitans serotype c str. SCC2302]KOE61264.1 molecular chaperone GrpE [Aggregatibacter actinomycetemcomitans serotype c str. AAS4A]KOE62991.1 molecular chaperone GrpE [Aggregatibacter actinomycetemcomitans serotype c str. D17P-2]KYK77268.1 molecular chaperone GrpE [Aggregatiba
MTNHQSADNQHELEQEIQPEDVVDELKEQGEDPLEEAIARVQELEAQLAETSKKEQDLLLRTRAEIDNIRRRTEQDIEKAHKFALEKFAKDILNTIDNLERALATPANTEDDSVKALFDGVELTLKELLATVARFGIEPVGAVGEVFDPELHQAISMQPAEGFQSNQITAVLQKGYLLNGRVIRPAMVMVAA